MISTMYKYAFLAWIGGSAYVTVEVFFRARSHWTMFVVAAVVFIAVGLLNELFSWRTSLIWQVLIGVAMATLVELLTGLVVNVWLGWGIWDYSEMPFNLMGQICPQFSAAWSPLILLAIVLDDCIRWRCFGEERPRYRVGRWKYTVGGEVCIL